MTIPASGALAVELHPHSPTHWAATYYPMTQTPAGRWADVTWTLHRRLMPATHDGPEPARWPEVHSPDPAHPCYAHHPAWRQGLAAGYAAARLAQDAGDAEEPLPAQEAQRLRAHTVVVPAEQLREWVLDDLQGQTAQVPG